MAPDKKKETRRKIKEEEYEIIIKKKKTLVAQRPKTFTQLGYWNFKSACNPEAWYCVTTERRKTS